jgi:hypothetical protein
MNLITSRTNPKATEMKGKNYSLRVQKSTEELNTTR